MEAGMEALHDKNMPFPEDDGSSAQKDSLESFENDLREENLRMMRNLRLKEMIGKAKKNDPTVWPFK